MSELKCPFCNSELVREGSNNYWCKKCNLERYNPALYGSQKLWQELIHTKELLEVESSEHELCHDAMVKRTEEVNRIRKALDVAADALKWIHETYNLGMGYEAAIMEKCESALEQITTIEQKDVK